MKKSIVISTPEAKFSALAFKEDFARSIKKVAELGYEGVELAIRDPDEVDEKKISKLVKSYHLEVPAIGTGQAYGEERLSFSHPRPEIRKRAVNRIKNHVNFAAKFSAQVIIGLIRGKVEEGVSREDAEKRTLDCIQECARKAQELGVSFTIEPINRYETNYINFAESPLNCLYHIFYITNFGYIHLYGNRVPTQILNALSYLVCSFYIHIHYNYICSCFCQSQCHLLTQPLSSPSHNCFLTT